MSKHRLALNVTVLFNLHLLQDEMPSMLFGLERIAGKQKHLRLTQGSGFGARAREQQVRMATMMAGLASGCGPGTMPLFDELASVFDATLIVL